jgi:protoheme ferro-lyase
LIVRSCPEKSALAPVFSLTSIPDALNMNSAAIEKSRITAVDIKVAFQYAFGETQWIAPATSTHKIVRMYGTTITPN